MNSRFIWRSPREVPQGAVSAVFVAFLPPFGQAFLEQGLDSCQAFGHADFQRGDPLAERGAPLSVCGDLGTKAAAEILDVASDPADADGEQPEAADDCRDQDR